MTTFILIEPYITGLISILGLLFLESILIASFKFFEPSHMTPKIRKLFINILTGCMVAFFSIYFTLMSDKENYALIFGNLRMIIIMIPTIFINRHVSFVGILVCSLFRIYVYGLSTVTLTYIFIFTSFYFMVVLLFTLSKKKKRITYILSTLAASIYWLLIYRTNFDGNHTPSLHFGGIDYLNFIILSTVAYFSTSYLFTIHTLFSKTLDENKIDSLTGIYNKKYFNDQFNKNFTYAKENHKDFSLAILDIDHFKTINDTYGHLAGDHILRSFSTVLKEIPELQNDNLFRIGGEEFALIVTTTNMDALTEKIRKKIENTHFHIHDDPIKITISVGFVSLIHDQITGISDSEFMEWADKALYDSKHNGRNKVSFIDIYSRKYK